MEKSLGDFISMFPGKVEQGGQGFAFVFHLMLKTKCPFHGVISATFFACLYLLLVISLFKMAPSVVRKYCLEFQSARRL